MKRLLQIAVVMTVLVLGIIGTSSVAMADKPPYPYGAGGEAPFLCPDVGNTTAAAANGMFGGPLGSGGYTLLPGLNQAGAHVNPNGTNPFGPGDSPGPGNGNSDWSPIWSYH